MKEFRKTLAVDVDIIDPESGEIHTARGTIEETNKYYSIQKLTSRINTMTLLTIMEQVCRSSKDIYILNYLLDSSGSDNTIRINNISKLAIAMDTSRQKLTTILKRLVNTDFIRKQDIGIYEINPFIYIGRKVRSNAKREQLQQLWQ